MDDAAAIRAHAVAMHGETWRLLEKAERTPAEEEAMIAAAQASLEAWKQVGTAANEQRGAWLVARAYLAAGRAEPALRYAARTIALTEAHATELEDFDLAFAEEIAARRFALAGDEGRAAPHLERARALGAAIRDDDDRRTFFERLEAGPWFGIDEKRPC